ncbi:MAG: two component transcriptional regulator, winged helix family [Deltaproteobacteria bacterium]|nr:two component transcriptional regulator, winged helix family [Deltaproteobacteria bacterium]
MKERILIVDDEPAIADAIRYVLETDGFETLSLAEGSPVLPLLQSERIDLIVLDVGLPDINGFDLCREIRKISNTPIMFLTARTTEIDRVVGLEIGADDYVVKPFSPRELSARIKAILRRSKTGPPAESGSRAFQVNESKRKITYFGKPLDLSNYEYRILTTFIRRPGHVYSRSHLMDLAWDVPEASMDRTVDAHVKNLRAKLKSIEPDIEPIITHRGAGYSLKENL